LIFFSNTAVIDADGEGEDALTTAGGTPALL
jgi:hypothetical protein